MSAKIVQMFGKWKFDDNIVNDKKALLRKEKGFCIFYKKLLC
jgi:hypothetical protein